MNREDKRFLALAAASAASAAAMSLIEMVRHGGEAQDLISEETVETLCDAAKMTLELVDGIERADSQGANQVLGALAKFLEGWAR